MGSPQTGSQPHCRQIRLPAGKGRAQPCQKPRKLPFPREAARQYDSKSYFTVAKERHVSKRKSAGQRCGILAPGAQLRAPRATRSPQNPAASPPSAGTPTHAPALTPFLTEGSSSHRHCGSQGPIQIPLQDPELEPPSHAPKASSRAKQETLLLVFLPLALPMPPAPDSGPAALTEEGSSCWPHGPG